MKDMNMDVCENFEGRKWRVCRVLVCLALGGGGGREGIFCLGLSCLIIIMPCLVLSCLHVSYLLRVVLCSVVLM
jgi:hypothetical protein